jgi:SAM-dependent methyltransferase
MSKKVQQQPNVKVMTQFPENYHDQRRAAWELNAPLWRNYVEGDKYRLEMLDVLAKSVSSELGDNEDIRVTDFGCGQGEFLMYFHQHRRKAKLVGIDFCESMLSEAIERSLPMPNIEFRQGDIEDKALRLAPDSDLVTAILALDEVSSLDTSFYNMASALRPGGHAVAVVLDPVVELLRHRREIASELLDDKAALGALLIAKYFLSGGRVSPEPYYRVIRPLPSFFRAAKHHGLQLTKIDEWPPMPETSVGGISPVFNIMFFRKALGN